MSALAKAFLLCDEIVKQPGGGKHDLIGAGVATIVSPLPAEAKSQVFQQTLWVYLQVIDEKLRGKGRLAVRRADSGRAYFFRELSIAHSDPVTLTTVVVRMRSCEFPGRGVYFIEFWYDGEWLIDQRLEVR
jgi:hypothetical protein